MSEATSVTGNDPINSSSPSGSMPTAGGDRGTQAPKANNLPAPDQYRDALKRLNAGEKPGEVNKAVFQGSAATATKPKTEPPANEPAPDAEATEPAQPAAAEADTRGLSTKELAALKRGKVDVTQGHWAKVPAANIKAIARDLMKSQSEADRAFQQQRQGGAAAGAKPGAPAGGQAGQQNAQQLAGDVAGEGADDAGAGDASDQPTGQELGNQAGSNGAGGLANFFAPLPPIDPQTKATLTELGGEPLVQQWEANNARLHTHFQQQVAPLMQGFQAIAGMLEDTHAREGFDALGKSEPAFANLTAEQQTTVKAKAHQLLRASEAPISEYSMREAVGDAARLVLSTNVKQAAQAQLITQRKQSLDGSPDKGTARTTPTGKPLSQAQLTKNVMALMQQGKTAAEARALVDAGNGGA